MHVYQKFRQTLVLSVLRHPMQPSSITVTSSQHKPFFIPQR
ncbi:hypothetical protein AZE42_10606 [Rhizopogon vesiculosus]|uniref:Uncharacterized protein n=1 Tax=Rhizopogon vesiculosus TaxID=180088 RepID=A0A1J8QAX6_9AGAM|nr:hypothetical protein AZE42_10606 [Rhizopogon vesiculosus]